MGIKILFTTVGVASLVSAFFAGTWYIWLIAIIAVMMLTDIYYQTYYEIDPTQNNLHIKGGICVTKNIPIQSIRKIEESKSTVSGPALSNQRLEIWYNTFDSILISPEHPIAFVEQLLAINADIEYTQKKK
ncbi:MULTISPECIES: PH domain-containing protein [unclassified Myroides]|uniref:PH domain-containing protein n=1 Tax=unclassified Myroides TaxID=2642485 RepID=UPI002103B3CC|nr:MULTISPECIES: PH domain-containing protein [unclassified Myroides]